MRVDKISIITPSIRPRGLEMVQECLKRQTFTDFEWLVEIGLGLKPDLNQAMNKMLRRATGEIVVSWQDYIKAPDNALEVIASLPRQFITYPVGKTLDWKNVKWDWRENVTKSIEPHQWEADFASFPLQALKDIGGYDEDFDRGWSSDNVIVAERASQRGYTFSCYSDLKCVAYDHDKVMEHPFRHLYEKNRDLLAIKRKFDHLA